MPTIFNGVRAVPTTQDRERAAMRQVGTQVTAVVATDVRRFLYGLD